jgi:serine/threonine protein kinase
MGNFLIFMASIKDIDTSQLIGKDFGTSTLVSELARGSMAIVFIAYQRTLRRRIGVKLLPKADLKTEAAELFQREAEAAAILSHPNIIQIYEVGEADGFVFFTMQLVEGKSLGRLMEMLKKQVLPSKRLISLKITIQFISQILDALEYAHQQGIIHRDIKPDNIMIEKHTQRPIITDFGVAKVLKDTDEGTSIARGTPLYMAPEQIIGEVTDGRTDIYAVGTMLFQMLVPTLPLPKFASYDDLLKHKLLNEGGFFLKKPSDLNPLLRKEMDRIIEQAIAYSPEKRYSNCSEFKKALEQYQVRYL